MLTPKIVVHAIVFLTPKLPKSRAVFTKYKLCIAKEEKSFFYYLFFVVLLISVMSLWDYIVGEP